MKRIIFINSHPIQYFTPLYKRMNEKGIQTACWYCTDATIKGGFDKQFGVNIKWDVPLLEGYEYKFFKNNSWNPSHFNGFFGLINIGMIRELMTIPKSVIVVHGWHYFTLFWILMLGKVRGHQVCLRCELPLNQEILKHGWKQSLKRIILKHILFPRVDLFLYIGKQNMSFYKSYGIPESRLMFCPYSVDNARFQNESLNLSSSTAVVRKELGIPPAGKVIIFSAKYIPKKRPLDVLQAFHQVSDENLWLIMVGEGELRPEMESFIKANNMRNVILTGFVNQSEIAKYYAIGDVFVMCSGLGETWGLSVNEAMNFDLPLIISDLSGCADDLVKQGVNGYTFRTGNVGELALRIKQVLLQDTLTKSPSSLDIVKRYSYDTIAENLSSLVKEVPLAKN
jgi:glycosyltransferase involved in cell wall biosynthesis